MNQHSQRPPEFADKSHHTRLRIHDLDMWPKTFNLEGRQGNIVLPAKVDYGLEADISIQMAMQFYERQG
jgi:hypothetical protein